MTRDLLLRYPERVRELLRNERVVKIEVSESLCYSYLRHVRRCWLVQTNWKPSAHWKRRRDDQALETLFQEMRRRFDEGSTVFKGTSSVRQVMRQGEIDVVGVDQEGSIHAMDVAFHEGGLHYVDGAANRVLKKMLRTQLLLAAYAPQGADRWIYFVSPKVQPAVQSALERAFSSLREHYAEVHWHLIINEAFHEQIVRKALAKTDSVADTSELFARSVKLLNLSTEAGAATTTTHPDGGDERATLQDLVRGLMRTLLEDCPALLGKTKLGHLMDPQYCKRELSLRIGGQALLRETSQGRHVNGYARYWRSPYGDKFFVCSQWWRQDHRHNATGLLAFLDELSRENADHPERHKLDRHERDLRKFVRDTRAS